MNVLSALEAEAYMDRIMSGDFKPQLLQAELVALSERGETADELLGFSRAILKNARPFPKNDFDLFDTCGTGGDGAKTFNISTAVAFVLAGGGVRVAKHGNRSFSSLCGSADVYEALGLQLHEETSPLEKSLDTLNFAFLFAPYFHPALKMVAPIRKSIKARTVFNLLGPLVNPAGAKRQILGVYTKSVLEKMAQTLKASGSTEALIVCSEDGLDEISLSAATHGLHLKNGIIKPITLTPEDAGLKRAPIERLKGGSALENAAIIRDIFSGTKGPTRDVVVLNAGAGFWISGHALSLREGIIMAEKSLDSGQAALVVENLKGVQ